MKTAGYNRGKRSVSEAGGEAQMTKFTEKAILDTFDNMLARMPFKKITVSAIVAECGISSNTFYYHFNDIYNLL